MKKFLLAVTATVLFGSASYALTDRKISVTELPAAAQTFLKTYFADAEVVYAEVDDDVVKREYEVVLKDGTKIEFDQNGQWDKIDCRYKSVPAALVPQAIAQYVETNYAGEIITEIDLGRYNTEVELSNGIELKFNKDYQLVKIDY